MTKEVKIFKTMQGIDFIGTLESESEQYYNLRDVLAVMPQQLDNGNVHVGLGAIVHPSLGKVDMSQKHGAMDVDLPKMAVLFSYEPEEQLHDTYVKAISGIEIAHKMPGNL